MSCLGPEEWEEGAGQKEQQIYKSQEKTQYPRRITCEDTRFRAKASRWDLSKTEAGKTRLLKVLDNKNLKPLFFRFKISSTYYAV